MRTAVLIVLDGFGVAPPGPGNPVSQAHTPTFDRLAREHFSAPLQASGVAVGLPWGEAGNSEVGHLTIGAGRIIYQYLPRIIFAIRDGSFFTNPALLEAVRHAKKNKSTLHLLGLISSGGVHAYIDHFYALLELAQREGLKRQQVAVHMISDGRDAMPREAGSFVTQIQDRMNFLNVGYIASIIGRFFAMDRDGRWERTERAFQLLTAGRGVKIDDPVTYITNSYSQGVTDEFLEPAVLLDEKDRPKSVIADHDAVIFFNFREDSVRQLTAAFIQEEFPHFNRRKPEDVWFATMTRYSSELSTHVAFEPPDVNATLGETIAQAGLGQLRIAETEKYAHVTYFFNGGREEAFPQEARILIPSITEPHFEQYPEMQTRKITEEIVQGIHRSFYSLIVANFANADMVGHTGNLAATIRAVEELDTSLEKILDTVLNHKEEVALFITADHGNAEEKIDVASGRMLTEHTSNPVPFYAIGSPPVSVIPAAAPHAIPLWQRRPEGFLADVAPTILDLLEIPVPEAMTGRNLFG